MRAYLGDVLAQFWSARAEGYLQGAEPLCASCWRGLHGWPGTRVPCVPSPPLPLTPPHRPGGLSGSGAAAPRLRRPSAHLQQPAVRCRQPGAGCAPRQGARERARLPACCVAAHAIPWGMRGQQEQPATHPCVCSAVPAPAQVVGSFAWRVDPRRTLLDRPRLEREVVQRVLGWAALGCSAGELGAMLAEDATEVGGGCMATSGRRVALGSRRRYLTPPCRCPPQEERALAATAAALQQQQQQQLEQQEGA